MTALFEFTREETTQSPKPTIPDAELKLRHILKTLPRECFERDPRKAWTSVLISLVTAGLGYLAIAFSPWYLLPLAWIFTGTALTGWFVIGHDCGHRSFAKRRWLNDLVGHIAFAPLIFPFHSWRLLHNHHHKYTNQMDEDNAWRPMTTEIYADFNRPTRWAYQGMRGLLWWLASTIHWAGIHFDWNQFEGKQRQQVRLSVLVVYGFALLVFPTLFLTLGVWGFVKFWLMPWLVYHFWMSTFTLVHHTVPEIQFRPKATWHQALAQLSGTVHCDYPRWVEFLCHDISVHVPHHLSTAIPSYNLRMAHDSLRQNWGSYLLERKFNWELMQQIVGQCHLYHPEQAYESFDQFHERAGL
jgi:acyl-lipid omega-6 desaturase (Delta-12 desaturase)